MNANNLAASKWTCTTNTTIYENQATESKILLNEADRNLYLLSFEDVDELQLLAEALHEFTTLSFQHFHTILRRRRTGLVGVSAILYKEKIEDNYLASFYDVDVHQTE